MYLVKLKPKAIKDLQSISKPEAGKIAERMKTLEQGLVAGWDGMGSGWDRVRP